MIFYSCSNGEQEKIVNVEFKDAGGKKSIIPCIIRGTDTILNGLGKYYYPNGKLEDEISFVNNLKNGWHTHYDSLGRKISKVMFRNNLEDGEAYFYDSNNLKSESFYNMGKILYYKWFDIKGRNTIYIAMDDSIPYYHIEFDTLGKKINEKGHIFSLTRKCFSMSIDSIKLNKEIKITIPVVVFPKYKIVLEVAKFNSTGEMLFPSDTMRIANYYAEYNTSFDQLGKQQFVVAGKLMDSNNKIIKSDTMIANITIVK